MKLGTTLLVTLVAGRAGKILSQIFCSIITINGSVCFIYPHKDMGVIRVTNYLFEIDSAARYRSPFISNMDIGSFAVNRGSVFIYCISSAYTSHNMMCPFQLSQAVQKTDSQ